MSNSHPVMTRVTPEVKKKLRAIAKNTQRSEGFLAREAIERYVEINDWQIALIEHRLGEANAGGETVSHDEVKQWLDAKANDQPLPVPSQRY